MVWAGPTAPSASRLDRDGMAPGGIGTEKSFPVWLRATRHLTKTLNLDLYGGLLPGGELRIEDSSGRELSTDNYQTTPFMALSFSWRINSISRKQIGSKEGDNGGPQEIFLWFETADIAKAKAFAASTAFKEKMTAKAASRSLPSASPRRACAGARKISTISP